MRSVRSILGTVALLATTAPGLAAQSVQGGQGTQGAAAALTRGLDLETSGKLREAILAYREAMADQEQLVPAVLGLERAYSQLGRTDSLLPVLDTLLARQPAQPTLRTVQLRSLVTARRDEEARRAFDQWIAVAPRDATPYREYARLLLDAQRTRAADSVLQEATRWLGSTRELAAELAQLRAALGLWRASSRNWRDAMVLSPYLDQAAVFSLTATPVASRDSVLGELLALPAEVLPRKVAAGLQLRWRAARDGWRSLADLPKGDSTMQVWLEFAGDAEANEEWLTARDAYAASLAQGAPRTYVLRGAQAALSGGDPASTIALLAQGGSALGDSSIGSVVLLQVRALALLARPQEAELAVSERGARLDALVKSQALRAIAWGWVRVGDLGKARAALTQAGGDEEERASAWIALYEGDLKRARGGLRRTDETTRDAVLAMSFLARTRADSSRLSGEAFLALARGDSAGAARQFERVAEELFDVSPLALGVAARLFLAAQDTTKSMAVWQSLVERYEEAPEAAEAELAWSRVLRRRSEDSSAVAHLEHLILTWPQSALVPQARRELDIVRGRLAPVKGP
jgi:tetratricopeptide (TPR) repeat protein